MQITSVLDTGDWAIDGPGGRGFSSGPDVSRHPETKRLYPNKPPGATLVGLGAYPLAKWGSESPTTLRELTFWARILTGLIPTLLLLGCAVWILGEGLPGWALGLSMVTYALATPANSYAHLFYGHQLAGMGLFIGILLLARAQRQGSPVLGWVGGLSAGFAVLVEYGAGFAGIPIGLMLLSGLREKRGTTVLLAACVGAAIPLAALLLYHDMAFGSPWSTGYHHVINPDFAEKHGQGFLGLGIPKWEGFYTHILSPDGGLLWWAPLFPAAIYGLYREWTVGTHQREALVFLSIFILMIIVGAGLSFDGGWRVGPRYLVAALPGLILGWRRFFSEEHSGLRWFFILSLGIWATCINAAAGNLWPHLDLKAIALPWSDVLRPLLVAGCKPMGIWGLESQLFWPALVLPSGLFLAICMGSGRLRLLPGFGAAFLGIAILVLLPPSNEPNRERNLRYIESRHQCGESEKPPTSAPIKPLSLQSPPSLPEEDQS